MNNFNSELDRQIYGYCRYCENVIGMTPLSMRSKRQILYNFRDAMRARGIVDLDQLTNDHLDDWIMEQRTRGCKGRTINDRLYQIRVLIRFWKDEGVQVPGVKINKIVLCKMEPPRQHFYTEEQIAVALKYADLREWIMIKFAFDCAMRMNELRNLRLTNINGRVIRYLGKGRKERKGYMSAELRHRLDDYIRRFEISDYLFPSNRNRARPMQTESVREAMRKPFIAANISGFYPHALRHSAATNLQIKGASVGEISVVLGHANQTTTERYMHALDDKRVEEIMENYVYHDKKHNKNS